MNTFLYLTTRSSAEHPLIEAECRVLLGVSPDDTGIAISPQAADVRHAAFIRSGMHLLFQGETLEELLNHVGSSGLHEEGFRVSVVKRARDRMFDSSHIAHEVGARIEGIPNLRTPQHRFQVVIGAECLWFGRVHSIAENRWVQHAQKPCVTSSSLPSRLARLMVNLGASKGDVLLDPCCGTGTLLIEAAASGIHAVGCDINERMVRASRQNLEHFGLSADLFVGDARQIQGTADVVVTDLPYGRMLPTSNQLYEEILTNLRSLAPRHVVVTATALSPLLTSLGYSLRSQIPAPKARFTRFIHVFENQTL